MYHNCCGKEMAIYQGNFWFFVIFAIALHLYKSLFAMGTDSGTTELKYLELIHEANVFNPDKEYDYIVVGGGTAGCPLAATLSENYSVLLLERGGDQHSNPNIVREENYALNVLHTDDDSSPSQGFTSEDGVPLVRGRVLGGTSMINFGFYSRGDDYFFRNSGIGWDMDSVKTSYEWVEESIVHVTDNPNSWQRSVRDALLEVGVGPDNGNTFDHLVGTKVSGTTFDSTGNRHGAVELLNKANPNNLRVIVHATVDKIIFSSSESSGLSAVGVVYHDSKGKSYQVGIRRNGEVILSAGTIGSPQLLLVSGVGPREDLTSLNIPVVHEQSFVGQYMIDNPRTNLAIMLPFPFTDTRVCVVGITKEGTYIESPSSSTPFTSPVSPIFFPDPSPHQVNLSMGYFCGKVPRPTSTGSLWLNSPTDVTITPSVRFNYYSKPEDVQQCADAVVTIAKMLKTRAMETYKFEDRCGKKYFQVVGRQIPENMSDFASMSNHCRKTVTTFYHYFGGCTVNKVVDSSLKVVGIGGLRVVDNSVFVSSPGTNPQATTLMLGRYIGVKIQKEREQSVTEIPKTELFMEDL